MNPRDHTEHPNHPEGAIEAATDEPVSLTFAEHLRLSVLWFGLNFQGAALIPIVLPAEVVLFVTPTSVGSPEQVRFLGYLFAAGAVVAMLVPPLVGALSDHTPGPLGRRRPYIVVGGVLLLVGVFEMAAAHDIARFVLGFILFQLGSNASTAAYQGLIPDLVPERQRGFASGLLGLMTILGTVASLGLAAYLFRLLDLRAVQQHEATPIILSASAQFYALTGFALVLIILLTAFGVRDYTLGALPTWASPESTTLEDTTIEDTAPPAHRSLRARLEAAWIAPFRHRNFAWVFLTRCFVFVGLTLFMNYIQYFFAQLGIVDFAQSTAVLATLALLGAIASSIVLGLLSDRVPRVPIVVISSICMAGIALAFAITPRGVPLLPLGILFGIGYGGYLSVDWALAVDALPSLGSAGKDMGIWTVASNLPAVIAPVIGALLITYSTPLTGLLAAYQFVFLVAGLFLLGGAVFVLAVREAPRPRRRPRKRADQPTVESKGD